MKYASVDIETTGLDPDNDQILQIAVVVDDTLSLKPIEELPFIDIRLRRERVSGSPAAMAMNAGLLLMLADHTRTTRPDVAETDLRDFFFRHFSTEKVTAAGKNFASFDRQFIRGEFPRIAALFHHRSLDPAMLYVRSDDRVLPSTEECLRRANLTATESHDALADARDVIRLIRTRNF